MFPRNRADGGLVQRLREGVMLREDQDRPASKRVSTPEEYDRLEAFYANIEQELQVGVPPV